MRLEAEGFYEFIKDKKIAFCGVGVSHRQLIFDYLNKGAEVHVHDRRAGDEIPEAAEIRDAGGILHTGPDYLSELSGDIIFRTPGMKYYTPELQRAKAAGAVLTSEMEMFFELCPCKIIAVTGSDGKTTTTTLISEILKAAGHRVHLGGNIGRALLPVVSEIQPEDFAVAELSSFQLISMTKSPDIAVITNITPNHLDIHKDMDEYINSKKNIFIHQKPYSKTVLNFENDLTASFYSEVRGQVAAFSSAKRVENGAFVQGGDIIYSDYGSEELVMKTSEITLPGVHNIENYLAAICATRGFTENEHVARVAREFGGVPHRMELVREASGVKYYNDSIATSPTSVVAGLRAFDRKIILLAGGYDKKIPYEPMSGEIIEHVKLLILCGDTADKIEKAVRGNPAYKGNNPEIIRAENMAEMVKIAHSRAESGDIVSLSPASASFDQYKNFEERGEHFKKLIRDL